jgi:alcohol dehydrogenase class IV
LSLAPVNWTYPTRIWFGLDRSADLPLACRDLGLRRPLLVIDEGFSKLPPGLAIAKSLADAGVEARAFSQFQTDPRDSDVAVGLATAKETTTG